MAKFFIDANQDKLIKSYAASYSLATGISVFVVDGEGANVLLGGACPMSEAAGAESDGCAVCAAAHNKAGRIAESLGESYTFFCPHGLIHFCAPIIVGGFYRGAFVSRPIVIGAADELLCEELQRNAASALSRGDAERIVESLPAVTPERAKALAEMLYILTKNLAEDENVFLYERKKFLHDQAAIGEQIQALKGRVGKVDMPLIKEKQALLIERMKAQDIVGARRVLNDLLGVIFFTSGSNLEVIRVRVLELLAILTGNIAGNASDDELVCLNVTLYKKLLTIASLDELCDWMADVLGTLLNFIFTPADANNYIIEQAIDYIKKNYMSETINLIDVANKVYLSPSYFSRVFKKMTNSNFIDFLNKVRIESSLEYLADLQYDLSDIAAMTGFSDQSYYSKVFKKMLGVTPGVYRKKYNK